MSLRFEWDPNKAEANLSKHEVSFEEAVKCSLILWRESFGIEEHSVDELREIIIGHSAGHQLILVNFTSIAIECEFSVHAMRLAGSAKIMKKTLGRKKKPINEETLRSEYRFDHSKSQPVRFAAKMSKGTVAIVLEPDVAKIFRSSEAVNALLRSIIAAMPSSRTCELIERHSCGNQTRAARGPSDCD